MQQISMVSIKKYHGVIMSKRNIHKLYCTSLHCVGDQRKKIARQENALDARFATLQEKRGGHLGPIY